MKVSEIQPGEKVRIETSTDFHLTLDSEQEIKDFIHCWGDLKVYYDSYCNLWRVPSLKKRRHFAFYD
jgi:hypothetical protein